MHESQSFRVLESGSALMADAGQELVDSVVAAIDGSRAGEVEQVRRAFRPFGLQESFDSEFRLSGVDSVCNGDCWSDVLPEVA